MSDDVGSALRVASTATGAPVAEPGGGEPAAATPAPPVVATWQSRPAEEAWAPEAIAEQLPWTRDVAYHDVVRVQGAVETSGAGAWQLFGISQRGRVHAHDGTHREDAVAVEWGRHGFILAAADGAGSSRYSRIAATLVCRQFVASAAPLLRDGIPSAATDRGAALLRRTLAEALGAACDALHAAAAGAALATRDFRTTALAAIAIGDVIATVQVGDGAIVTIARDGHTTRLGTADSGSYSGEVVAFVPEVDFAAIESRVVTTTLDDVEGVLVLTDGIEDPFYPVERRGTEIARQLYHGVTTPADGFRAQAVHGPIVGADDALALLEQWIAFERRGENDDRTLAGAFRRPGTIDR